MSTSEQIKQAFDSFPYLNQYVDVATKECVDSTLNQDCIPPSEEQLDRDIANCKLCYQAMLTNKEHPEFESLLLMFNVGIKFLQAQKCIIAQYPCANNQLYQRYKTYINLYLPSNVPT